jgi:hypothetical protein
LKFDITIGNPPYSKGIDLDFINIGYKISKQFTVMITPAKWQTTSDDYTGCSSKTIDYKEFRDKLVPHMSTVVFYPNCADIFEIKQIDGITYFILDKKHHEKCKVVNKCKNQPYFNSIETRSIAERKSLHNIGQEIINSLGIYESFKFNVDLHDRYQVWTNSQLTCDRGKPGTYQAYGFTSYLTGQCTVLSTSRIIDTQSQTEKEQRAEASTCTFSSDSKQECESFISWLNTKFTRFFIAINISKLNNAMTDDCFRFVPSIGEDKFDHIYTDKELYEKFGLSEKYREVIDTVIKEKI